MCLRIRRAEARDAGVVLAFTRALATYEGTADEVLAEASDFTDTLFAPNPHAFCEIAEWNGEAAGFAVWFYSYSIFLGRDGLWLEDLFVHENFRRLGIGQALFAHLAERCVVENLGRLEWSVLEWNRLAIGFYEKLGADFNGGRMKCRLTAGTLTGLASRAISRTGKSLAHS